MVDAQADLKSMLHDAVMVADYHTFATGYWRGEPPEGCYYDDVMVELAITFVETYCIQSKGQWAGQPVQLMPWQKCIIATLWGWRRDDGTRQLRTAYIEVPRKNGKSTLCSALALLLLFADGEAGAEIYMAAGSKEQAKIVFAEAKNMLEASQQLAKRAKAFKDVITVPATRSKAQVISADAEVQHGLNPSGIVFDELHVQPNRELYDVLRTATGARRQPLNISITTAGYDRESLCWEQHDRSLKTMAEPHADPTHLGVIYAAEEGEDWTDRAVWAKANPGLGFTVNMAYLEEMFKEALLVPGLQNTFKRLHLNMWTSQDVRWIDMALWDACREPEALPLAGRKCYGGLDLASTNDMAAFALVFPPEEAGEPFRVRVWYWIPGDNLHERVRRDRVDYDLWGQQGLVTATPGNVIDYGRILDDIVLLGDAYNIQEVAFDRWGATQVSQQLEAAGFSMVAFGQGMASMARPTREFGRLVASRGISHDGNRVLRWNVDNVTVESDAAGNIKPSKKKSREKIDGLVAAIMGLDRAMIAAPKGSVYDTRGIREL